MTLSIRNALRSLSLLALTAAFIPGCDGEEYEALGLSAEDIDLMSEEELDELTAEEDEQGHSVDTKILTSPLPDPTGRPDDLTKRPADGASGHTRFEGPTRLWDPTHTHTAERTVDGPEALWDPAHTHTEVPALVEGIAAPVHPTHGAPAPVGPLGLPDPGCKPHTELPRLNNG